MDNTFALWGFITAGCIAVILVYVTIADRWYKLKARIAELEDQKQDMQRWLDKQRQEIIRRDDEIADLLTKIRCLDSKLDAQRAQEPIKQTLLSTNQHRRKGFKANNDLNVWHKAVPYQALAKVQMRIDEGNKWANISRSSDNGYVFKISHRNLNYSSQNFSDRNHAKQFRDSLLHKYFHRDRNERGAQP